MSGEITQGKRIYPDPDSTWENLKPGEYVHVEGHWICCCPGEGKLIGTLDNHRVTEHEDGTITVTPSILCAANYGPEQEHMSWHGYLERGIWREV